MRTKPFDILVAYDRATRGIGFENEIPWCVPSDRRSFLRRTMGGILILGRKTWDSMASNPLPGRFYVVITQRPHVRWKRPPIPNVAFVASFEHALRYVDVLTERIGAWYEKPAFVVGGQTVYDEAVYHPRCRYVYATEIQTTTGDIFPFDRQFPVLDFRRFGLISSSDWQRSGALWMRFACYRAL